MNEDVNGAEALVTEETVAADHGNQGGRKNERSKIAFPYVDLASAVSVAHAVQEESGYIERMPANLGYSSVENGSFRLRLMAARTFGLIAVRRDRAELTEIGQRIIEPSAAARAKVDAFMCVPLYKEVYDRHKGRPLPSDSALEADLVSLGVAQKQKVKARQVFKKSAEEAGFYDPRTGRLAWPKVDAYPESVEEEAPSAPPRTQRDEAMVQPAPRAQVDAVVTAGLPPAFVGLVRQLAENGSTWSEDEKKAWIQAMEATFTFVWPRSREPRES